MRNLFERTLDHRLEAKFYGQGEFFTIEDLYQEFKARMERERRDEFDSNKENQ